MSKNWPTKEKDIHLAQTIMEEFSQKQQSDTLSFLELVVNQKDKRMTFRLSNWVFAVSAEFTNLYGASQGDFVTRQVLSKCITKGHVIH